MKQNHFHVKKETQIVQVHLGSFCSFGFCKNSHKISHKVSCFQLKKSDYIGCNKTNFLETYNTMF